MANLLAKRFVFVCKIRLQRMHTLVQIPQWRRNHEVEMVIHDGVRIKDPLMQFDGIEKGLDKKTFRGGLTENEGTTFGSIVGVVDALIRKLAETAGHGGLFEARRVNARFPRCPKGCRSEHLHKRGQAVSARAC